MTPERAPKSSELLERINALVRAGDRNEIKYRKIINEAIALRQSDAPASYQLEGLARISYGDEEGGIDCLRKARHLEKDDVLETNYFRALTRCGLFEEALDPAKTAARLAEGSTEALLDLMIANVNVGDFDAALDATGRLEKLKRPLPEVESALTAAKTVASHLHLSTENIMAALAQAASFVREAGARGSGVEIGVAGVYDGEPVLALELLVHLADDVIDLNRKWFEFLAENPSKMPDLPGFSVSFVPHRLVGPAADAYADKPA